MSSQERWVASRRPTPPRSLTEWLTSDDPGAQSVRRLVDRGIDELDRARAAPGPVRESALHLLAADAWVTYACGAALESSDPDGDLLDILEEIVDA